MGVYASWLNEILWKKLGVGRRGGSYRMVAAAAVGWSKIFPKPLRPDRTIVVSLFEPPMDWLCETLGGIPRRMALPGPARSPLNDVTYVPLRTDVNPLDWGKETDALIGAEIDTVASLIPWNQMTGRTLKHWWSLGIRRCWFLGDDPRMGLPPFWGGAWKWLQGLARSLPRFRPVPEMSQEPCRRFLEKLASSPSSYLSYPSFSSGTSDLSIVHFIHSLNSGGAERQMCNLAMIQKQAGHKVRVFLERPPLGRDGHYLPMLEKAEIPVSVPGSSWQPFSSNQQRKMEELIVPATIYLPEDLRGLAFDLAAELWHAPADVLHCWMDVSNIKGLVAGIMARVPALILSLRSVSPVHTPWWGFPWMRSWYQVGAELPGVTLTANSEAGARDYENWLNLQTGTIRVIRNCLIPPSHPGPKDVENLHGQFSIDPGDPVLAGVFRLDPEKRPLLFCQIVDRLRRHIPNLHVFLAGCGGLEKELRAELHRLHLEGTLHYLGQREDVGTLLSASQVLLQVSIAEGMPNVPLEAQFFGCVPVMTDAGGAREVIVHGKTGLIFAQDDIEGIIGGVAGLLKDRERRQAMVHAGRELVLRAFLPEHIYQQTQEMYEAAFRTHSQGRLAG